MFSLCLNCINMARRGKIQIAEFLHIYYLHEFWIEGGHLKMPKVKKVQTEPTLTAEEIQQQKDKEEAVSNVVDNARDWFERLSGDDNLKHAAVVTCKLLRDNVGIVYLDEMWPFIPMVYSATYEAIVDYLASKRTHYSKYKITVGKNFVLSYDNIDTGEAEQEGCFMPMMEHVGECIRLQGKTNISKKVTYATIDNMYSQNFTTNSDIEHIKANAAAKLQKMYTTDKDGKRLTGDKSVLYLPPNLIMIIFTLYHDSILMRLKMMKEADPDGDIEMNVLGLYTVSIEDVDPDDANYSGYYIKYEPKDIVKLSIKDNRLESEQRI